MLDRPDLAFPTIDHIDTPRASVREVLAMSLPVVVRMASLTMMAFVDALMVARVGKAEMAAVNPASLAFYAVFMLIDGLASTNNTFVAQAFGARQFRDCARYTWHAIYMVVALGLAVQVIQPHAAGLFGLMGHEEDVQVREMAYFQIRLLGAAFVGVAVALSSFFQGISRPRVPMVVALMANGANVGLNYLLIFGRLGLPRMGIRGAALGTVIATAFQALILLGLFLGGRVHRQYQTRRALRLELRRLGQFIRIGGPVGIHWALDVGTWAIFVNIIVGRFGTDQLTASNIASQFLRLSWLPTVGLNIAATQLVGQWIGRGRPDIAQRRAVTALKIGMAYMAVMGLVFLILRRPLISLFRTEPEVIRYGASIMIWAALFQVSDAIGIVLYGALKGAGDTLFPAVSMLGSGWLVFLPAAWLFAVVLDFQAPGAWIGAALHITVVAGLMYWRFRSGHWRRLQLIKPAAPVPLPVDSLEERP